MKKLFRNLLFILPLLSGLNAFAQTQGRDFQAVDAYVKKLGSLDSMTMGTISTIVCKKFTDKTDKARAIFDWITGNISFDIKAAHGNRTEKNSPTEVLASRKGVSIGFASLFQDMCSSAGIRCLTVDGFVKVNSLQIGDKSTDINHTWAVVQLGESPDTWFYVDPTMGSGFPDAELKVFTPYFNDGYFFADKQIFNWQHFPDNAAWKLGAAPKDKGDFFALPIIKGTAYELGLRSFLPKTGIILKKANHAVSFGYKLNTDASVSKVTLVSGEKKKQKTKDIEFNFSGGMLTFEYKFEDENSYPVSILINGKEFITYQLEVE